MARAARMPRTREKAASGRRRGWARRPGTRTSMAAVTKRNSGGTEEGWAGPARAGEEDEHGGGQEEERRRHRVGGDGAGRVGVPAGGLWEGRHQEAEGDAEQQEGDAGLGAAAGAEGAAQAQHGGDDGQQEGVGAGDEEGAVAGVHELAHVRRLGAQLEEVEGQEAGEEGEGAEEGKEGEAAGRPQGRVHERMFSPGRPDKDGPTGLEARLQEGKPEREPVQGSYAAGGGATRRYFALALMRLSVNSDSRSISSRRRAMNFLISSSSGRTLNSRALTRRLVFSTSSSRRLMAVSSSAARMTCSTRAS